VSGIAARIYALVTLASSFGAARASAQYPSVVSGTTAGTTAGLAAGRSRSISEATQLAGKELEDWRDAGTLSSSRLNTGCNGVVTEVSLSGRTSKNYANVTIYNGTSETIAFVPDESVVHYESGLTRRLVSSVSGDIAIESNWLIHTSLAFQDKAEIRDQNALTIAVSVRDQAGNRCTIATRLQRNAALKQPVSSYTPHTAWEIEFFGGVHVIRTGSLGELAPPAAGAFGLHFAGFPWFNHGFSFDLELDWYPDAELARVSPELASLDSARLTGAGFVPGYVGRLVPASWLMLSYNFCVGPYFFELDTDGEQGAEWTTLVFPIRQRVKAAIPFLRLNDGSTFYVSGSAVHLYVPYGTLGQAELRGTSLAAFLGLGIGE
jgi:hypothetical protein